ncbi:universal stress protein [Thermodesulfobacteriota bacterium]
MTPGPAVEEEIEKKTKEFLERVKDKASQKNVSCETIVRTGGQPHEFIVREAKEKEIDLIVMGTHGKTGLKKLIMGSVAQRVIGYAPCSVLVIPSFPG